MHFIAMMYNVWGLTRFWDDLRGLDWKCPSDEGQTAKFQLIDSTSPVGGVESQTTLLINYRLQLLHILCTFAHFIFALLHISLSLNTPDLGHKFELWILYPI